MTFPNVPNEPGRKNYGTEGQNGGINGFKSLRYLLASQAHLSDLRKAGGILASPKGGEPEMSYTLTGRGNTIGSYRNWERGEIKKGSLAENLGERRLPPRR